VFKNWVLRKVFVLKEEEVIGNCGKLHNEVIFAIVWGMRWVGHVACMREKKNTYRVLIGKSEGKMPLGRSRLRWKEKTKIFHNGTGWEEENEGPL
jgi:hypothetical protein